MSKEAPSLTHIAAAMDQLQRFKPGSTTREIDHAAAQIILDLLDTYLPDEMRVEYEVKLGDRPPFMFDQMTLEGTR